MKNSITENVLCEDMESCPQVKQVVHDALLDNDELSEKLNQELKEIFGNKEGIDNCHFNKISLVELTEHIIKEHHQYSREMFPIICSHIKAIALKYGMHHPELINIDVLFSHSVKMKLNGHMMIEETVLYPRIKLIEEIYHGLRTNKGIISIESIIKVMKSEHKIAMRLIRVIRELTDNYTLPDGASSYYRIALMELQAFEIHLTQSICLQESILFPKALEMLKKLN